MAASCKITHAPTMRTLLLWTAILLACSCQPNKLEPKHLTTVSVKRDLSALHKDTLASSPVQPVVPKASSTAQPIATTPTQSTGNATPAKQYHIIAASHPNPQMAEKSVLKLKAKGLSQVQILLKEQRYRVSIAHHSNKQRALQLLDSLTTVLNQDDLWITRY